MEELEKKIEKLAQLIVDSEHVIALTGAGMSTESGIADFRSPGTGLWERLDPYEFGSIDSYRSNAKNMFEPLLEIGTTIFKSRPNKGHRALTKLQKLGKLDGVMTQNIDNLHQRAHTKNIVELHGNVMQTKCIKCDRLFPITNLINKVLGGLPLECDECRGMLKPNAIFFGEVLESDVLARAEEMVESCDLMLVLGSSLVVYPVAFYPRKVLLNGEKLAIINIQETDVDDKADVVIHEKIGNVLPKVVSLVRKKLES